jgi:3-oxoacyl-[acyl-carrier protein] reductase
VIDARVAIVTGGSRGIGRAICLALGARGFAVVVAARTEREPADPEFPRHAAGTIHEVARAIEAGGGRAQAIRCDLTRPHDIRDLVAATLDRFGRIDVLVNNAGIDGESPVAELPVPLLDRCLAVNVRAPLLLCRYALPTMIDRGAGSIIGITSNAARAYRPRRVVYSMTKAALERALVNLAEEVRPYGIAVNVLNPGRVDTWMNRRGDWPGTAHIPMVSPDVVAPAAVWLAQQSAATFTGHVVDRAAFGATWGPGAPAPATSGPGST